MTAPVRKRASRSAAWRPCRGARARRKLSCAARLSTGQRAQRAAEAAFAGAEAHEHNAFKIELGKRTLVRALFKRPSWRFEMAHDMANAQLRTERQYGRPGAA